MGFERTPVTFRWVFKNRRWIVARPSSWGPYGALTFEVYEQVMEKHADGALHPADSCLRTAHYVAKTHGTKEIAVLSTLQSALVRALASGDVRGVYAEEVLGELFWEVVICDDARNGWFRELFPEAWAWYEKVRNEARAGAA